VTLPGRHPRREFETLAQVERHLQGGGDLNNAVFQSLDLRRHSGPLMQASLGGAIFLGCRLEPEVLERALSAGALVFPRISSLPFDAYRGALYSPEEIMAGYEPAKGGSYQDTYDGRVYQHFLATGGAEPPSILETLARRLHDHAITDALTEFIAGRRVVAIMGGHSLRRDDPLYLRLARISRRLSRAGFLMASGGGPGAMEATHLGAWMAPRGGDELAAAAQMLAAAPTFDPLERWLETSLAVKDRYPLSTEDDPAAASLGVPTWLYGHEPPTVFATHIAKYFANSVREDGLLTIARHGVIFSPGSAGTVQEIFQDATQNHYLTAGVCSPMVFFGRQFWEETKPVYPLLVRLAKGRDYAGLISIADTVEEVVSVIDCFSTGLDSPAA